MGKEVQKDSTIPADKVDYMTCLKDLVKDERCLDELSKKLNEFNLFDVLKSAHWELKHSNVLAWLLNPCGNHLLGRRFFDALVRRIADSSVGANFLVKTYIDNDADIQISTEEMNIDLLIVADEAKWVVAIENKIWSKEHDKQLSRYRRTLESIYKDGWHRFYFYLTPNREASSDDPEYWSPISYQDVYDAIQEVVHDIAESNPVKPFIQQYCKVIEREIMGQSDIEDLCHAIYRRHTQALNQIFGTVGCGRSPLRTLIENVLRKLEEDRKILHCKDRGHYAKPAFHTVNMDNYFGKKANGCSGSWGNDYLYVFWFDRRDPKKLTLRFEVGPLQATLDELDKINAMMRTVADKKKVKDKTSEDQYCRIWQCTNTFNTQSKNFSTDELDKWIRKCVNEVLQQETNWIDNAKKELEGKHASA